MREGVDRIDPRCKRIEFEEVQPPPKPLAGPWVDARPHVGERGGKFRIERSPGLHFQLLERLDGRRNRRNEPAKLGGELVGRVDSLPC